MKRYWYHIEAFGLMVVMSLLFVLPTNAQFNPEINYQGKLTDSSGVAVPDGTYQMVFRLYTAPTGGTAIWTETLSGANEVSVANGLFSVMLGSTSALTAVDFNQTLYLGVTIESDSEMTPRKILGAVPAAFVAEEANNAATVGGVASSSFVRSDQADSIAATTASTLLSITQSGTGNILDVFDGASSAFTILDGGNIGIGTSSPSQLLSVGGNAYITGTITGATWGGATIAATRGGTGLSTITQNQLLIGGAGNTWTQVATSSLGLSASFSNSSQLAALLSDETGTGNAVFSIAPTFTGLSNFADLFATNASTTNATTTNLAISSLTSGRVPYVTTSGRLIDSANLTFNGTSLTFGTDAALSRGAANRLDLASGDSLNLILGNIAFNGTNMINASTTNDSYTFGELAGVTFNGGTTDNIAIGFEAGRYASTTSADQNIYIGKSAGSNNTGSYNIIMSDRAAQNNKGSYNFIVGGTAGMDNTGSENNFIGYGSGAANTGSHNNYLGLFTGTYNTGNFNDFIGYSAGASLRSTSSVLFGSEVFVGQIPDAPFVALNNTAVGYRAGYNATNSADNNILIGYQAADNLTTGNNNIIIGYDIDNVTATTDNALNIGNLLFGTGIDGTGTTLSSGNIGIGTSSPSSKLTVAGDFRLTGAFQDSSYYAGASGMILQSTGIGTGWVATSSLGLSASFSNSSQLAALLSDETGTGNAVFSIAPTFTGLSNFADLFTTNASTTNATTTNLAISSLTSGRVPFATTGGRLIDSANLTFSGSTLTIGSNSPILTFGADISLSRGAANRLDLATGDSFRIVSGSLELSTDVSLTRGAANRLDLASGDSLNLVLGSIAFNGTNMINGSTTNDSYTFGENAGATFNSGTTNNIAIGFEAGRYASTTDVTNSVLIGLSAGIANTAGENVLIGTLSGQENSGWNNVVIGNMNGDFYSTGQFNAGAFNVILGTAAGNSNQGSDNQIIGQSAGYINTGSYNNIFGRFTGFNNTGSYNNIFGHSAGQNNTSSYSEFIGFETAGRMSASSTVAIGGLALRGGSGFVYDGNAATTTNNVAIGYGAGYNTQTGGDNNILIGYQAADNLTTGNNNIIIGYDIDNVTATTDNALNIGNLIFGTGIDGTGTTLSNGNIGIGTSSPTSKLTVAGDFRLTGAFRDSTNSAGTSGMILQSTGTGTGWVATSSLGFSSGVSFSNSSELAALLSDETGTGNVVFSASPTFTGTAIFANTGIQVGTSIPFSDAAGTLMLQNIDALDATTETTVEAAIDTLSNLTAASSLATVGTITTGTWQGTAIGDAYLTKTGNWTGTFDGQEGTYYLSRANHTGTQATTTITGVFNATNGGTGLSTITQNQLLIGGAGNTWTQVATSSLGLSASFSNSSQLAALLSDETGTGNAVFSASPTFTGLSNFADLFTTNASTTNATTTNLAISSLTSGRVPFATTGGSLIDSANLTFDGARFLTLNLAVSGTSTFTGTSTFSGRIGVGTTSPSSLIDIWGDARFGTTSTPALFVNTATNQTQFPSGSVSIPGFSFYNDGNTGLHQGSGADSLTVVTGGNDMFEFGNGYMSAAEDINFTDTYGVVWGANENTSIRAINGSSGYIQIRGNATEHFRIMNATGNVGIGSTSPSSKLTVTGSFSLSGAFKDRTNSAGTSGMILKTTGTETEWVATSSLGLAAASDLASYLPLTGGTLSGNLTFSGSSANIALGSNWLSGDGGDEGIYVDSSGNVGVGTTTTTLGKLSVAQTAANQGVTVFGAGANASNFGSLFVTGSGELVLQAGGLGLGGLAGTSQTVAIWNNNTLGLLNDKELSFGTSGDYSIGYNSGDDTFRIVDGLDVAANTRLLINASGYVGIGTTSPMSLLSVAGASVFTGQMNMVGASANIALGSNWLSGDGGDEGLLVNSFGEVNIGSTTSAGGLLQIGSVYYPSVGARALNIDTMIVSSSTTFHGVAATPTFAPLTDLTSAYGIINRPTFASSSNNIANAFGTYSRFDTAADYTGTITNGYSYFAGPVTQSGTKPVANYYHYFASNITNGNGTTSGAIENAAFWSSGLTAEAGSGGSVTNYGLRLTQPSGNTTGTNNYGIYISGSGGASASNNYSFYNASVANSYFDGKVGIGSTSPAWPLSVTGQAAIDGPLRVAGVSVFSGRILTGGVTTGQNAAISLGGTHQPFIQEHGTARNEGSTALFVWANNAAGPELSFNKSRGAAIGTQTIVNNADVLGAVVFAGSDGTNPIPAASIQGEVDGAPSTNDMPGRLIFSTTLNGDSAPTEHMRITNAGYVGIGTTTPVSKLVLQASPNYGQMDIVASTANGEAGLLFKSADDSDANGWLIGKNLAVTDDSFSVYRNGTNHMVVNTTGYVGIGTTTPKSPIHIYANVGSLESVERNSTTASGWTQYLRNGVILGYVGFDSSTGGSLSTNGLASSFHVRAENALQFSAGGAGVDLTIDTTGNVGVGTTTPADKFQAYGDIRVGTGTTGCVKDADGTTIAGTCSSDERLKMDITPLASSSKSYLEALVAIEPSTYYWNEVASDEFRYGTTSIQTGLIAQQVALTMPEMVTEDHRGYKQVRFSDLPIYLLQAIKEMWSIVDGFKEQFTTKELCIGDTCVTEAELQTLLQNAQQQPSSQPPSVPDQDPSSDPATEGGDSGVTDDSGATDTPPAEDNPPAEPPPDGSTDGSSGAGGG